MLIVFYGDTAKKEEGGGLRKRKKKKGERWRDPVNCPLKSLPSPSKKEPARPCNSAERTRIASIAKA